LRLVNWTMLLLGDVE